VSNDDNDKIYVERVIVSGINQFIPTTQYQLAYLFLAR
jgi:hypothetical protein